jgi:hypothetical protein
MNRSAVSVLPPMQAGGWMAEENNVNATPSQRDAPLAYSRKPVLAVSVNGQLLGCLQGFLVARNNDSNQSLSGPLSTGCFDLPAIAYAADILMLPEGLRRGASEGIFPQQLPRQNNFALDSSVEWSKKFSYPLLCSLQQVLFFIKHHIVLKFMLLASDTFVFTYLSLIFYYKFQ